MSQRLFTMDYPETIDVNKQTSVTKDISTGDANWEIVDVLIDKYVKGKPTTSVTKKTVGSYYQWNVGFYNAGGDDTTISLKLLVINHPQPISS